MKLIFALIILCILSCNEDEDTYKDKYSQYEPIAKHKTDSMQIINKFIDGLPDELKSRKEISEAYKRNLDASKQVCDNAINLLSQDIKHYDSVMNKN